MKKHIFTFILAVGALSACKNEYVGMFPYSEIDTLNVDRKSTEMPEGPQEPEPPISEPTEVDMTSYIQEADYLYNSYGAWKGTSPTDVNFQCFEQWDKNYNNFQDIQGLPAGYYKLSVQGYYRRGYSIDDAALYAENSSLFDYSLLYAQSSVEEVEEPLVYASSGMRDASVLTEQELIVGPHGDAQPVFEEYYIPNNMRAASIWFNTLHEYDTNSLIVKVGEDGNLRIGIKKETLINGDWTIVSNWKLTYYKDMLPIQVKTGEITSITDVGATVTGHVSGVSSAVTTGIIYGRTNILTEKNGTILMSEAQNDFFVEIKELTANTLYFYRAFTLIDGTYHYGNVKAFTTVDSEDALFEWPNLSWGETIENIKIWAESAAFQLEEEEENILVYSGKHREWRDAYLFADGLLSEVQIRLDATEFTIQQVYSYLLLNYKIEGTGRYWVNPNLGNPQIYTRNDIEGSIMIFEDDGEIVVLIVPNSFWSSFSKGRGMIPRRQPVKIQHK